MLNGLGPKTTAGDLASLLEGALSQGLDSTKLITKPNGTQYARLQYRTRELATRALSAIASSLRSGENFFPASVSVDRWSSKERRVKKGSQSTNGFVAGNAHSAAAANMNQWNGQLQSTYSMYPQAPQPPFGSVRPRPPFPPPGPGPWANNNNNPWANYNPWTFRC